jgi:hypothetical protein
MPNNILKKRSLNNFIQSCANKEEMNIKKASIMNKWMHVAVLMTASGFAIAQNSETRTVPEFKGVRAEGIVEVELVMGTCGVAVTAQPKVLPHVTTEVQNGILIVSTQKMDELDGDDDDITVRICVSKINHLEASGVVEIRSDTLTVDSLEIVASGATDVRIPVKGNYLNVELSGASELRLSGKVNMLNAEISGASELKAYHLSTSNATVVTSGASEAKLNVSTTLNGTASGASDISYYGNPTNPTLSASGTSSIEHKDGEGPKTNSTQVKIGNKSIEVSDDDDDQRSIRERMADDDDFEFWDGFDLGVNGYLDRNGSATLPNGFDFMELDYARSYLFAWNIVQKNIHIYKNYVNLGTGIGLSWYHYSFKNNYTLDRNVDFQTGTLDTVFDFGKNRFNTCYVNVPLFFEFNTNNSNANRSFHIGAGMQFGYNIFKNKLKQKYEVDGRTDKRKYKDNFNVNPFRYDFIARIGYGNYSIFGAYSLSTLYAKGKGPVLYPFTAGIHIEL